LEDVNPLLEMDELVLKKKVFSVREHYDLEDRGGTKVGEAEGNLFQFPAKFVVTDIDGLELMYIEGKIFSIRKQFSLYDNNGNVLGTIKKKLVKLIGQEYWIERDGAEFMRIHGDFTDHDYLMQEANGVQVASVHKKWFAIRDQLGLSILGKDVDHRLVLGALIVIEHLEVTERAAERSNQSGC
jgi:uncharacterized protein YxjI